MKGQRYALSPNANQAQLLRQWIGCQRFIYNAKVQVRWHQAYQRFFKQLGGRPKLKTKQGRQSVFITRELFTLTQTKYGNWVVVLGTKKHPMGAISLNSKPNELHENHLPASICIAIHAGKWSISFATAELDSDGNPVRYPEYTRVLERLRPLSLKEVEQLDVQAMTASAKGTKEKHGKNVRQKSGLNRSILSSNWGRLRAFVQYKSFRRGKLFVSVPAPYTSQECSHCRTINRASRRSQSLFACDACGFQDNADVNASQVIAKQAAWGIYQHLHSGQELSTRGSGKKPKPQTPVELLVSRDALKTYHAQGCETGNPTLSRLHIC